MKKLYIILGSIFVIFIVIVFVLNMMGMTSGDEYYIPGPQLVIKDVIVNASQQTYVLHSKDTLFSNYNNNCYYFTDVYYGDTKINNDNIIFVTPVDPKIIDEFSFLKDSICLIKTDPDFEIKLTVFSFCSYDAADQTFGEHFKDYDFSKYFSDNNTLKCFFTFE